jgi:DNA-binding NarL/FixJ family response regulator
MSKQNIVIVSRSVSISTVVQRYITGTPGSYDFSTIGRENELEEKLPYLKTAYIFIESCFYSLATAHMVAGYLRRYPKHKITVFTGASGPSYAFVRFLYWGVERFISFREGKEEILKGLRLVLRGEACIPPEPGRLADSYDALPPAAPFLTPRELEIVRLMADGFSGEQIAEALCLNRKTVKNHRMHIYRKCNVNNPVGLMKFALNRNIIRMDDLRNQEEK